LKKIVVTVATVTVVGLGSAFFTDSIHAEPNQESIQDERSEIKADLSKAESEVADVLLNIEKLNEEVEELNDALEKNQKTMKETETEIEEKEEQIETLKQEISDLEEKIEKRYEILKERAVSLQKSGGDIGYIEVIFGSKSFSDFINRISAVSKISDSDQKLIEQQEADKQKVEEQKVEVEDKLAELDEQKVELKGMAETIKEQKKVSKEKVEQAKKKEEELNSKIAELKLEDEELVALQAEVEKSLEQSEGTNNSINVASTSNNGGDSSTTNKNNSKESKSNKKKSQASSKPATSSGSGNISTAINAGFAHLGTPYVTAGKTPSGFDCSGFVSWAFAQAGYNIPSYTGALAGVGTKVSYANAQPGDLVFFDTYKTNGHVGIYLGGGEFIGAQNTTGLAVADMTSGYWKDHFSGHVRRVR